MKKSLLFSLILSNLIIISFVFAKMELPVSIASYRNLENEKGNFTELYYSINRNNIVFTEKDDSYLATFVIKVTVFDDEQSEKLSFSEKSGIRVLTESETNLAQDIHGILTFYVQPGDYFYELELSGDGIDTDITMEGKFHAPDYSDSKLQLSQIEFCTNISTELSIKKFVKNNLLVYPNPSQKYAMRNPIIFFYAEVYNLAFDEREPASDYELTYFLLDSNDDTAKVFATNRKEKAGSTSVVANLINARRLEQGTYKLVLQVKDLSNSQIAQQTGVFYLEDLPVISTKDAEEFRKQITYIVDSRTLGIYDELDIIGKQNFMESFWKERDPSPDTPINEFKHEYLRRWQFVNDKYGNESINREGWQSDRGRIYLIHGTPTDIERYYGGRASKDHEIWIYEGDQYGIKQFVFADLTMRGRLILIHSQSRNQQEVYNPNWRREIDVR